MLFNSLSFYLFFPIVTILYFLLPHKLRWLHLLAASCVFYMAFVPVYILILFFTIIIDYAAGILIEGATGSRRKWFLVMSLAANIGVLAFFKYYNFFAGNVNHLFHWSHTAATLPILKIILPIGLSFHTFQAMSYTIEVYRGNQKAERHFGIYSLYVMFYPQLVAGPIERPQNLLYQFYEKHSFNYNDAVAGLRQMLWGLFKKTMIADRLGLMVDPIYNDAAHSSASALIMATVFFTFQVYCDFSGYSDIALGAARVMGFKLMVNFNKPFGARSVSEFWRKWHISLSTWLSDYVYTPLVLELRNIGVYAVVLAALTTFLISGLWHGAAWQFIAWGALHGTAIAYEVLTKKWRRKLFRRLPPKVADGISHALTFTYLCFSFIFFRAGSLGQARQILRKLPHVAGELAAVATGKAALPALMNGIPLLSIFTGICYILFLEMVQKMQAAHTISDYIGARPKAVRWGIYFALSFSIYLFGVASSRQFIYFQF